MNKLQHLKLYHYDDHYNFNIAAFGVLISEDMPAMKRLHLDLIMSGDMKWLIDALYQRFKSIEIKLRKMLSIELMH